MNTILKTTITVAAALTLFTGCSGDDIDAVSGGIEDFDKIIIYNNFDPRECDSGLAPGSGAAMVVTKDETQACEDYGRSEGSTCSIREGSLASGPSCVVAYNN